MSNKNDSQSRNVTYGAGSKVFETIDPDVCTFRVNVNCVWCGVECVEQKQKWVCPNCRVINETCCG